MLKNMPLFGKSQKSPAELVKALKEAVNSLERGDKKAEKAQEDVSKNLVSFFFNSAPQKIVCTFGTIRIFDLSSVFILMSNVIA